MRILLADDDDVDREKFRRLLTKTRLSVEVIEASSGKEAVELLCTHDFDCIVLDYRLGDTTGIDLLRELRGTGKPPAPVIMVTGLGDERVAVSAMREGVYDYLSKVQLNAEEIVGAIEGSLRRAELESELTRANERLRRLSMYDALTGLPNRNLFFDRFEQVMHAANRGSERFALILMDLDHFKEVNDTFGHEAGDKLLVEIGRRLERLRRASDTYARLGGDEFAGLLVGCDSVMAAVTTVDKVQQTLREPMVIDGQLVTISMSTGIALVNDNITEPRTLLAQADRAMYRAKRGSRSYELAAANDNPIEVRTFAIASHLHQAVSGDELFLRYQPQVRLDTGEVAGVEALVRWRSPQLGIVKPGDFIPSAERSSLIKPITYRVLEMALDQAVSWKEQGWPLPVSVNLSVRMLDERDLPHQIDKALTRRGLSPAQLTLELTETALMTSPTRAQEMLSALRAIGVGVSIDDFGTGYTSLKYLRDFDISEIKIDKVFIESLDRNERDTSIVRSVAELSRGFDVTLVAEGIEDEASCELLRELGCDCAQGYAIGRPMPAEQVPSWWIARESQRPPRPAQLSG